MFDACGMLHICLFDKLISYQCPFNFPEMKLLARPLAELRKRSKI
jgi:hypothetical protein